MWRQEKFGQEKGIKTPNSFIKWSMRVVEETFFQSRSK